MSETLTKWQRAHRRWSAMDQERSSWREHWQDLSRFFLPRAGRFVTTDRNRGERRNQHILDSTGTRALRVLAAGLMAGMTSPARPWFKLKTPDRALNEHPAVRVWLDEVTTLMREVFAKSNTYRALHQIYTELGLFGTAATIVLDDFDTVIRHEPLTIGEYAIAKSAKGKINSLGREFEMTVAQLVEEFGLENCSEHVKSLYTNSKNLDAWIKVLHLIQPREYNEQAPRSPLAKHMAWESCYYEWGRQDNDKYLRESGFKRFAVLSPRWLALGGDIYGSAPGQDALGDQKGLQLLQKRKAQGIDYMTRPPLQAPTALKEQQDGLLPGGVVFYDAASDRAGVRSAFDVRIDLSHVLNDIEDHRRRINETFYVDLFLMLANMERTPDMTAREIAERHEEKLLMLGPTLESLHDELLGPLVDITFGRLDEAGALPPPPEEIGGMELSVEFVSMLAQAQRAVGTGAVDRLLGTVGAIAQFRPEVVDKIDTDQLVDDYADMLGVPAKLIVSDDDVVVIREQRAKQQAAAAQAEQAAQQAQTAKTLSETSTDGDNALTNVIGMFSGYSTGGAA